MKKRLSVNEKEIIVKEYQDGISIATLCKKHDVSRSSIYRYIKEFSKISTQNPTQLHKSNMALNKVYDILAIKDTVNCTIHSPLKDRLLELEKLHGQYSVYTLCTALNVDRGTYYNHIYRSKKEEIWYKVRKQHITNLVIEAFHNSNQIFGPSKITVVIRKNGNPVSEKYVRKIMKENGLKSVSDKSKKDYNFIKNLKKEDKLKCDFKANNPNEIWVSDTTQFRVCDRMYYICVIIDLFSRKVIAHKISSNHSTNLVTSTFKYAYKNRNPTSLIFHSDRGRQYTSYAFMKLLNFLEVQQSFSPSASPRNNAVVESFFSYLKREELYRKDYTSYNNLKTALDKYIVFYNDVRPHSFNNNKTPTEYEMLYNLK